MSKHFDAILAKNQIARFIRRAEVGDTITAGDLNGLRFHLREIEVYIGEGNQPSISDIIESEHDL